MLTIRKWFPTAFQRVTVMVGVLNVNWIMLLRMHAVTWSQRETGHWCWSFEKVEEKSACQCLSNVSLSFWLDGRTCFFLGWEWQFLVVRCLLFFSRNCTLSQRCPGWLTGTCMLFTLALSRIDCCSSLFSVLTSEECPPLLPSHQHLGVHVCEVWLEYN